MSRIAKDPLAPLERNDPCWCDSGKKYKKCHGAGPRWAPGAPIPHSDENGEIWIAPDVALAEQAVKDLTRQMSGAPIWAPSQQPTQRPPIITAFSAKMAQAEPLFPTLEIGTLGRQRFEVLDELGLSSGDLRNRLASIGSDDFDALVHATFSTSKGTLDRLLEEAAGPAPPTALWTGGSDPSHIVGSTLFWADRYLSEDVLAEALLRHPNRSEATSLQSSLRRLLDMRPLVESGVVGLVPHEALSAMTGDSMATATESDLKNPELVSWLLAQFEVEGPTAREVVFINPRDHDQNGPMYFYGHLDRKPDERGFFTTRSFQSYDPQHDYSPWIDHTKRQTAAKLLQEINGHLAVSELLGAQFLSRSLFYGRLLQHKGHPKTGADALLWADVPILSGSLPSDLARVAADDEAVASLRRTVRGAFRTVRLGSATDFAATAAELGEELEEGTRRLRSSIAKDRAWKLLVPAGLSASSIAIGSLISNPFAAVATGVPAALASLSPYIRDRQQHREAAAYALLIARRGR